MPSYGSGPLRKRLKTLSQHNFFDLLRNIVSLLQALQWVESGSSIFMEDSPPDLEITDL